MQNSDATERYLADIYANPVPAPDLQLRWARDIDRAQGDFNRAVADSPAAGRCLVAAYRRQPGAVGVAHMLARWAPGPARSEAQPEAAVALIEACMVGLEAVPGSGAAHGLDERQVCPWPLRLRTEFMAEVLGMLCGAADVHAETLEACRGAVDRIRAATERLVHANQRLVAALARQYRSGPLSFMDLVQEGNLGLLRAIERFDPDHGTRVSTYSMWWVRRAMVYAMARQGREVRPSVAQYWAAREVTRTLDRLEREQGRRATYRDAAYRLGTTVAEVQRHLGTLAPALALDAPIAAGADATRIERLAAPSDQGPEQAVLAGDMRRAIGELLEQLPERHARILRLRFGIGVREDCTLEQIAQQQGVTRERIRQLEAQALTTLRRLDAAWVLRGCLG